MTYDIWISITVCYESSSGIDQVKFELRSQDIPVSIEIHSQEQQ